MMYRRAHVVTVPLAASKQAALPAFDARAVTLLQTAQATLSGLKSLSAEAEMLYCSDWRGSKRTSGNARQEFTVRLMKPNFIQITEADSARRTDGTWDRSPSKVQYRSDGSKTYYVRGSEYEESASPPNGEELNPPRLEVIEGFFSKTAGILPQILRQRQRGGRVGLNLEGTEAWEGSDYQVVVFTNDALQPMTKRIYIGADHLVHHIEVETRDNPKHNNIVTRVEYSLREVHANAALNAASFGVTLPVGSKTFRAEGATGGLLTNGTLAPAFTIQDKDGDPVRLSDFKGKVVVLDSGRHGVVLARNHCPT